MLSWQSSENGVPTMTASIPFAASVPRRAGWAVGFMVFAVSGVWLVEARVATAPDVSHVVGVVPAHATATAIAIAIEVTASYEVAAWTVTVDGTALVAVSSDVRSWRGASGIGGRELFIDALPVDLLAGGPAALRITVQSDGHTTTSSVWGDGAVGARIGLGRDH